MEVNAGPTAPHTASCEREPIHIPGSIQPHGVLLIAEPRSLRVNHVAGPDRETLGIDCIGLGAQEILGEELSRAARRTGRTGHSATITFAHLLPPAARSNFDVSFHAIGGSLAIEIEPCRQMPASLEILTQIDAASRLFERADTLGRLCRSAAAELHALTGYDRVMVYRFHDDGTGQVIGEHTQGGLGSFLHHHFPASDIPRQARQLYIRNPIRVIPDVGYQPAPLRPAWHGAPLDMSDCGLRSVAGVHIEYLRNMNVEASASVSIIVDGALWGLIACHNATPRTIAADRRIGCQTLAGILARQIKAREETDSYRERVRLRSFEDEIVALLSREGSLDAAISNHLDEIKRMLDADGVAVLRGNDLVVGGKCPEPQAVRDIAGWVKDKATDTVFHTETLGRVYPRPLADAHLAAGLLAITLSTAEPWVVLWFRAEQVEVINWAGNPHKDQEQDRQRPLTPRASFAAWGETVRGTSRRWSLAEVEAANRLRASVLLVWQNRKIRELNRQLLNTLDDKELLLRQKEFLIGEVNHRTQNSLQLVSGFLQLQSRSSDNAEIQTILKEAIRRIAAVSMVHKRLYRIDQVDAIDAARYIEELLAELMASMGDEWSSFLSSDLQPVMLPADRAIALGLVLTELLININKYAYGGRAGPVEIRLREDGSGLRLIVADSGTGRTTARKGFGTRMMDALVTQLDGTLDYESNDPGTRAILTARSELRPR